MQRYNFYLKVILKRGCNIGYEYIKGVFILFIYLLKKYLYICYMKEILISITVAFAIVLIFYLPYRFIKWLCDKIFR